MTKQETYDYLRARGVAFEITEHPAVFNMEECAAVDMPYPEDDAKNIFVRDAKKQNYYLITIRHDKRVDLKEFQRRHGTTRLSFASPEDLMARLHLAPGSVTPLGLLNDPDRSGQFYLDRTKGAFLSGCGICREQDWDSSQRQHRHRVAVHPGPAGPAAGARLPGPVGRDLR